MEICYFIVGFWVIMVEELDLRKLRGQNFGIKNPFSEEETVVYSVVCGQYCFCFSLIGAIINWSFCKRS